MFQVVKLSSKTFNYNAIDRAKSSTKKNIQEHFPQVGRRFRRIGLPPKVSVLLLFFVMHLSVYPMQPLWPSGSER